MTNECHAMLNMYEKPPTINKVYLMQCLFHLNIGKCASVEHINEFNMVIRYLSSIEINFDDKVLALILLFSSPDSWNDIVTVVSNSFGSHLMRFVI